MNARKLPPLILHPFADAGGPEKLVESSRASLVLQGLLPAGERNTAGRGAHTARRPFLRDPHAVLRRQGSDALDRAMYGAGGAISGTLRGRVLSIRVSPRTWWIMRPKRCRPS